MAADTGFARARGVLERALSDRAFPGAVAEVGRTTGSVWRHAVGRLTFAPTATPASVNTVFDLASLTKVLATASISLALVHRQQLALDAPVAALVREWSGEDRASVTVRDLLEHCSGLPGHRPYYKELDGGEPTVARDLFRAAICGERLAYLPGTQSLYSDPGFILLGFILEELSGAPLDVQFAQWLERAGIDAPLTFNPPVGWRDRIAPTEDDPWRGRVVIGEVHDENAAALGGVAAHAGLFGTAGAVGACARWWLSLITGAVLEQADATAAEAKLFVTRSSVPGSSRALAWDTMLPTSSCGTGMTLGAVGHTGFTGTSLWLDPAQNLYAALLTNRVHPTRANDAMQPVRRAFHDAVVADLQECS